MKDTTINLRAIQHYLYCPRRFGLLEINKDWAENAYVVNGNILHENVHSEKHRITSKSIIARSAVALYNDEPEYDIFGIADCIEFIPSLKGSSIIGLSDKYDVAIVEYKPRKPKQGDFNESDAIQVYGQKVCADYIWGCNSRAFLYYADVRKRTELPFERDKDYYSKRLTALLKEMREILQSGIIPSKCKAQKCSGCSIADICFPKEKFISTRAMIAGLEKEYEKTS